MMKKSRSVNAGISSSVCTMYMFLQEKEFFKSRRTKISDVKVVRIAQYINEVVATRKLPEGRKGSVVMKLDVEGGELEIVADLIMSGALANIDNILVDWNTLTIKDEDYQKFDEDVEILTDSRVMNFRQMKCR